MSSSDGEQSASTPLESPFKASGATHFDNFSQYRTPSPTRPFRSDNSSRPSHRAYASTADLLVDFPGLGDAIYDDEVPPSSYADGEGDSDQDSDLPHRSEHRSAGFEFGSHVRSTPRTLDGIRRDTKGQTVKIHRKYLAKALGTVVTADADYVEETIIIPQLKAFSEPRVNDWLETEAADRGIFDPDDHCWLLPQPTTEFDLYDYYIAIIKAILKEFVVPQDTGIEREIRDIHNVKLSHLEGKHKTSPDLVVRATGSSFETPSIGTVGYANMATFIDVKLDGEINKKVHLEQLAGYVEQIFAHQPNRLYFKCLLLSEKRIRLVHFDRAGAEFSQFIDLVEDPEALVRLIIALCSTDERELGFDTSIQWSTVNGKKTSGTMKTYDLHEKEKIYELVEQHPIAQDFDIRGRGTTLWKVCDPDTKEEFLVKQSWTSQGRPHEHLHLLRAKDIPGVCDIVGYEVLQETRQFRCPNTEFANRTGLRIIMRLYGEQIDKFKNVLEALRAIRDAVAAHEMLWRRKILHRDITNKNILLGTEDAVKGSYGVLIDLGVALDFQDESNSNVTKEARSGSRFFQSCVILEHLTRLCISEAPAHDYLDDLECFFYVLCFLFFLFHPDGSERDAEDLAREVVQDWDSEKAEHALAPKSMLFNPARGQQSFATLIVAQSWGPACGSLFKGFLEWVWGIQQEKEKLLKEHRAKLVEDPAGIQSAGKQSRISENPLVRGVFAPLLLQSNRHYAEVLALFDIAIAAIELSPAQGASPRDALEKRILVSTANSGPSKSSRTGNMSRPNRSQQN